MNTVTKQTLSADATEHVIRAAIAEAEKLGVAAAIAVLDESGVLKGFHRMDGAPLVTVQSAQDKAYTAVGMGIPSHTWYPMIEKDPALLHGVPTAIDRLVIFGGGVPVKVDGQVVGGIGTGGGSHQQDRQISEAGLATLDIKSSDS